MLKEIPFILMTLAWLLSQFGMYQQSKTISLYEATTKTNEETIDIQDTAIIALVDAIIECKANEVSND